MLIGQVIHWISQMRREIKDDNSPVWNIGDFLRHNRNLIILNFSAILCLGILNGFAALITCFANGEIIKEGVIALASAGYFIDSTLENWLGDKLKATSK